jgi:choline dehydrogenase-like flavoprotein
MKIVMVLSETEAMRKMGNHFYKKPFPGCEHTTFLSDEYWECAVRHYTQTLYHYAGAVKMGPFWDPDACVDPELRFVQLVELNHES